jgi:signal transduction histidine kinase/DNA-binding response OmpR family regulator/ligand-binding sensor domain-containing protein
MKTSLHSHICKVGLYLPSVADSILLLFFLLPCTILQAQNQEYFFVEKIEGVESPVHKIVKDKYGYVWLGCRDGLLRFDGDIIKTNGPQQFDGFCKNIFSILKDHKENFWIGSSFSGLYYYSPALKRYWVISSINNNDRQAQNGFLGLSGFTDFALMGNDLYIANQDTLTSLDGKVIVTLEKYKKTIKKLFTDPYENLWISLENGGLVRYNKDDDEIFYPEFENDIINCIASSGPNSLWLGTEDELIHLNPVNRSIQRYPFDKNLNLSFTGNDISSMVIDNAGNIWIGFCGFSNGIMQFNQKTIEFTKIVGISEYGTAIENEQVLDLYFSIDDNILWIGTESGLHKIVWIKQKFKYLPTGFENVNYIYQDPWHNIWVGDDYLGLAKIKGDKKISLVDTLYPRAFNSSKICCFIGEDPSGNIYAVNNLGLVFFNSETYKKNLSVYIDDGTLNEKIVAFPDTLSVLVKNDQGKFRLYHIGDTITVISDHLVSEDLNVNRTCVDQFGNIFGYAIQNTRINSNQSDPSDKEYIIIYNNSEIHFNTLITQRSNEIKFPVFPTVVLKAGNTIWIGSNRNGLMSYNLATQCTNFYGYEEHIFTGLLYDDYNRLWASSNKGIVIIDLNINKNYFFSSEIDIPLDQINYAYKGKDGYFYFGGNKKNLIFIDPEKAKFDFKNFEVYITGILINNNNLYLKEGPKLILEPTSTLNLTHKQNSISIEIASLNYFSNHSQYYHMISGINSDWIQVEKYSNRITYLNLHPGSYKISIKAVTSFGIDTAVKNIEILINKSFWKSRWGYFSYSIVIFISISFLTAGIIRKNTIRMELKRKEIEMIKLKELDTIKSKFFSDVSHEFRTPLTLILSPLRDRILKSKIDEDKKELELMYQNGLKLLSLVNQYLDLSKLDAGILKLSCVYGNIQDFLIPITNQFSTLAKLRNIEYLIQLGDPVRMFYDPDKVEKIITNLLTNAFKYTPVSGRIKIELKDLLSDHEYEEGHIEICVEDSGPGIEEKNINHIFERFYQSDNLRQKSNKGAGIGLAIVKEFAELHHGKIEVKSIPGMGSRFVLFLPLGYKHLTNEEIDNDFKEGSQIVQAFYFEPDEINTSLIGNPLTPSVYVVEDDSDLLKYIINNLKVFYRVQGFENGSLALNAAKKDIPELIVSDLVMPEMDGIELFMKLRDNEATSHILFVLLTGKADVEDKVQGLEHGVDDYISKPFDVTELRVRIGNLIENRKRLQEKYKKQIFLSPTEIKAESKDEIFLKRIRILIEDNMENPSFSVKDLADGAAVSKIQLYRKLKVLTGYNPNELIRTFRLEKAAALLKQKSGNIAEIAYQVGFNNLSYFTKCFKERFKVKPSDYNIS